MKKKDISTVLLVTALSIATVFSSYADTQGIFELNMETYPTVPAANDILQKAFSDNSDSESETTGFPIETNASFAETTGVLAETSASFAESTEVAEETAGIVEEATETAAGITESVDEAETDAMDSTDISQTTTGPTLPADYEKTEEELLWELENKAWIEEQLRLQNEALHALQIGEFFKDSVLVGDSVAEGFNLYAMRNPAFPIFQNLKFLTKVSYSVHNAFMSSSYNPRFQGAQMYAWDSMRLMGIKHAYTFFGLNDLGSGVDNTVAQYLKYIARVQQEIPDIKITIVSTTPMYKGSEKKVLNNANIRALNAEMAELAAENGWGYIDVASRLCDSDGCLAKQYCSDKYVHQNNSAYQIWQAAFEEYAEAHLEDSYNNA
ncbi:MAG: hypothetical protein K6A76_07655 [Oribacterium sp.]|nr:hypothetical protein [Oribacterium sp.]